MSRKNRNDVVKVTYRRGTKARAVVRTLLDNTGRSRGGYASDYNFVRSVAEFGNTSGFITGGQMAILGAMYNRILGNGQRRSWKNVK